MSQPILQARGLTVRFGGLTAVDRVELDLPEGQLAGLIGPNGAGKTTCFNLFTGRIKPNEGKLTFAGQPIVGLRPSRINQLGMARTFQNIRLFGELSVLDNVLVGFHGGLKSNFLSAILRLPGYVAEERGMQRRAGEILELTGLTRLRDEPAGSLAYGQQRLLEIARALATDPKLILLDEPAAGMNPQETTGLAALVRRLRDELGVTVLLIEHDMRFVMKLCEQITVLDHGKVIARGAPHQVQRDPAVIQAYLGAGEGEGVAS
ncbi:MAG: ABC transporter ATP-binding protein [Desulfarculaceae bacterium]|nr:ABC transporter ATP-binding protein [Desulfarculaceae bacterium]MCF8073891.1 ABC transporter ATP-binding protein [Desulfarculaceae bacterium]MCF8102871.1 ABC transporter ATP-binding protein [Desulfarculaceae bacterium]MCF8116315.1 ABC transporter ATP-binding protein [Desulfarculaceae bacterium]